MIGCTVAPFRSIVAETSERLATSRRVLTMSRYVPLPKSETPSRILSNSQLYDFELSTEDMASLDALDRGAAGAVTWNPVESD